MIDCYKIDNDQVAMDCTMLTINGEEAGVCLGSMDCDKCKRTTSLLVAAPDMYKALKEIKQALWDTDCVDIFPDELDNICIALAKAEGNPQ